MVLCKDLQQAIICLTHFGKILICGVYMCGVYMNEKLPFRGSRPLPQTHQKVFKWYRDEQFDKHI